MGIKKYQPTSPGRRGMTVSTFEEITTAKPEKSLLEPKKSKGGRNNQGRLTTRHQGGGHKQMYRKVDFKRAKDDIPAKVASIEYDPTFRPAFREAFPGEVDFFADFPGTNCAFLGLGLAINGSFWLTYCFLFLLNNTQKINFWKDELPFFSGKSPQRKRFPTKNAAKS